MRDGEVAEDVTVSRFGIAGCHQSIKPSDCVTFGSVQRRE